MRGGDVLRLTMWFMFSDCLVEFTIWVLRIRTSSLRTSSSSLAALSWFTAGCSPLEAHWMSCYRRPCWPPLSSTRSGHSSTSCSQSPALAAVNRTILWIQSERGSIAYILYHLTDLFLLKAIKSDWRQKVVNKPERMCVCVRERNFETEREGLSILKKYKNQAMLTAVILSKWI